MVDLADRRVLGQQLALPPAQLGDVAHEDDATDAYPRREHGDRPELDDRALALHLDAPRRTPSRDGYQILVDRAPTRDQLPGHRVEAAAGQVSGKAEPAVGRERVGAREGHDAVDVEPDEAVTGARRGVEPLEPAREREAALSDHPGQLVGDLDVRGLQAASAPRGRRV